VTIGAASARQLDLSCPEYCRRISVHKWGNQLFRRFALQSDLIQHGYRQEVNERLTNNEHFGGKKTALKKIEAPVSVSTQTNSAIGIVQAGGPPLSCQRATLRATPALEEGK